MERSRSQLSTDDKDASGSPSTAMHPLHASPEDMHGLQMQHGPMQETPMVGDIADTASVPITDTASVPLLPGEQLAATSNLHNKWTKHNARAAAAGAGAAQMGNVDGAENPAQGSYFIIHTVACSVVVLSLCFQEVVERSKTLRHKSRGSR